MCLSSPPCRMSRLTVIAEFLLLYYVCRVSSLGVETIEEEGGYLKREHSLVQPFHGSGMDVPYWKFGGSTVISNNYVRLTPDRQSKKGILWNTVPVRMHNWEAVLHFHVHGQAKSLYGDGFAFWYAKELGGLGAVFGSQDYFTGIGVFFDTYSNHNGQHSHEHPYISAMVNNGSLHYDHDRDGTHSQVSGCTCYFRNAREETFVAITYMNRQIKIFTNIDGGSEWKACFSTDDVDLPTGYFFGVTAATGDLADNHDIISMRVYDIDEVVRDAEVHGEVTEAPDWSTLVPRAGMAEAPREHVEDVKSQISADMYKVISVGLVVLLVVGLMAVLGGLAFLRTQDQGRKRYF